MFQRIVDDFKGQAGTALRLTSLAAAAAIALFVTTAFLCAAAFILALEKYGPVEACLTGAAIFFVVTLIVAGSYMVRKRQISLRAQAAAKSTAQTMLADPMVVAACLQLVRTIGIKKADPAACGRRIGAQLDGQPQPCRRPGAGGIGLWRISALRRRPCSFHLEPRRRTCSGGPIPRPVWTIGPAHRACSRRGRSAPIGDSAGCPI
jgi:hypothetical protein